MLVFLRWNRFCSSTSEEELKLPEITKKHTIETGIGDFEATARISAKLLSSFQISLKAIKYKPLLPSGMEVTLATAVVLEVHGVQKIDKLSFQISTDSTSGHPATGQCLDAQEWDNGSQIVVVGTEDGEALSDRFPTEGFEEQAVTIYSDHALNLSLADLNGYDHLSFHFIIAENEYPEPVDASAWFAVEQRHSLVTEQMHNQRH